MPAHETKSCPRCGSDFECRVGSITKCQCSEVSIDADTAEELTLEYGDCLCHACLEALASTPDATTRDRHQSPSVSESIRSASQARRKRA